jgi:hypothetical protein
MHLVSIDLLWYTDKNVKYMQINMIVNSHQETVMSNAEKQKALGDFYKMLDTKQEMLKFGTRKLREYSLMNIFRTIF